MGILDRILRRPKVITYSIAPDTLKKIIQDAIQNAAPNITVSQNLASVSGTSLTRRDWSQDLAKLQNLDTLLSTRASEATLSAIKNALASVATDKLRISPVDAFPLSPINLTQVGGTAQTGRDWSGDLAKLQNLDTLLSSRASESTLSAIKNALASVGADKLRVSPVDAFPLSPVNISQVGGTALTGRDWSGDFAKLQNLDTTLSSRASETTLSGIKSQTDKLTFDTSNRLAIQNPPNLDVLLSTRASESTLSGLSGKFPSAVALADNLSNPTTTIIGVANLGWDGTYWRRLAADASSRLRTVVESVANPSNLDVALSTRASESTLSGIKSQTDKLTFDASNYLQVNVKATVNPSNLDVALSTRASESTLSGIKSQTDKLTFDTSNYLQVNVKATVNPSNLDVALSTRASESTLSGLSGKFPSATALGDSLSNPTTTIIGGAILGFDGTYWRRVRVDTSGRLAIQNPPNMDVTLSTLATLQRFGRNIALSWVDGGEVTAPAAGTALVSRTVTTGKSGYIYGFFISAGEGNIFKINWTSGGAAKSRRIVFNGSGTLQYVDIVAINEGVPADGGSSITITNVNAGSTGVVYQACILYGEV